MKKHLLFNLVVSIYLAGSTASAQIKEGNLQHPPPVPYFFITGLCFGDTTHFINKTTSKLLWNQWSIMNDKGDTIYSSTEKNAAYYFRKRGFYTVCLTAHNGHTVSKNNLIRVDTITKADFTFRYCYDQFDNLSACSDQFVWVLPDNSVSTDAFPSYHFSAPGKYPVKLVAKKAGQTDTLFKLVSVRGDSMGMPDATFTSRRIDTSTTFEFTAVDSLATKYAWYFGDKQSDDKSGYKVVHHIDKSIYIPPVNLFITNACGSSVQVHNPFAATAMHEEKKPAFSTIIYPNPVKGELNVLINHWPAGKTMTIELMDARGRILEETRAGDIAHPFSFRYNTAQLQKDIYLLRIMAGDQLVHQKIIVQ